MSDKKSFAQYSNSENNKLKQFCQAPAVPAPIRQATNSTKNINEKKNCYEKMLTVCSSEACKIKIRMSYCRSQTYCMSSGSASRSLKSTIAESLGSNA